MTLKAAEAERCSRRIQILATTARNSRSTMRFFVEFRIPIAMRLMFLASMISFGFTSIDSLLGTRWMSMWRGLKMFLLTRDCSSWLRTLLIARHFKFD
uniref:Uncharacterized protein n=1 Tax=Lotus japonicus TaxID=34305 RepID=I3SA89_LOTJA|nr:unknown [Lotus japonicus]